MYLPAHFCEGDLSRLLSVVDRNGFATLVTTTGGVPSASQIPLLRVHDNDDGKLRLFGHLANENPELSGVLSGKPLLVIFSGAHSYVSPSWYVNPGVPTWNYISIQVRGRGERISERDEFLKHLAALTGKYEASVNSAWSVRDVETQRLERALSNITGFYIVAETIEGKFKLSQNRPIEDQLQVIEQFGKIDNSDTRELARMMAENISALGRA